MAAALRRAGCRCPCHLRPRFALFRLPAKVDYKASVHHETLASLPGRIAELREDRQLLVAKLRQLGLLRTEPDPERESLLEIVTGIRRALGGGEDDAMNERLEAEEREYLRLLEALASHDEDERLVASMDRARAAIANVTP